MILSQESEKLQKEISYLEMEDAKINEQVRQMSE